MAGTKIGDFYGALGMNIDTGAFARADRLIGGIKKGIAAFVGFKATQMIVGAIGDVIEHGGEIADAAQKTGVAAETLQQYGYAAGLAGSSTEEMVGSLGKLNKNLDELRDKGKGAAADGLKSIGINVDGVRKQLKSGSLSLDELLLQISDRFAAMPDGPRKVAAAMDLFGKSGANLIPTLNQGRAGLQKLKQEANELGIVLSNEQIGALDEMGDDIDRAKAGWQGFKNQVVLAIAPLLQELLPGLIGMMKGIGQWAREHKLEIAAVFHAAGKVAEFLWTTIKRIARVLVEIGKGIVFVAKKIGTGLMAIGRFFVDIGTAGRRAFDAVVGAARAAWNWLSNVGTGIVETFKAVGNGIVAAFKAAFEWVVNKAREVGETISNLPVIKQLGNAGRWIGGKLKPSYDGDKRGYEMTKQGGGLRKGSGDDGLETQDEFEARTRSSASRATPTTPAPTTGAMSIKIENDITVNPSPGMDEQKFAEHARDVVDARIAQTFRQVLAQEGVKQ